MKIANGYVLRRVGALNVIVVVGNADDSFHGMVKVNDTGAFLWNKMLGNTSSEELAAELSNEFGIDAEKAARDVNAFLKNLRDIGAIEE